jgi:hypothetical protein
MQACLVLQFQDMRAQPVNALLVGVAEQRVLAAGQAYRDVSPVTGLQGL